jgi:hypothetical protein
MDLIAFLDKLLQIRDFSSLGITESGYLNTKFS